MRRNAAAELFRNCIPIAATLFLWASPALAQNDTVTGARLTWFGVYHGITTTEIKDDKAPGGSRYVFSEPKPPQQNDDQIPRALNTRFGFGFKLLGQRNAVALIRVVKKYPAPGLGDRMGRSALLDERDMYYSVASTDLINGFSFGGDPRGLDSAPLGVWTFQIWQGDRMLLEKRFTVYEP